MENACSQCAVASLMPLQMKRTNGRLSHERPCRVEI
jgi:hypothetical protein